MDKLEFEAFLDDCAIDLEETIGTSPHSRDTIKGIMKKVAWVARDNMIENASRWLSDNVNAFIYTSDRLGQTFVDEESLVKCFGEAMEE